MKTRNVILGLSFNAALLLAPGVHAMPSSPTAMDLGTPVSADDPDRTVVVNPDTHSVNVNSGETVRFEVNGKAFSYHFDDVNSDAQFDLAKIAPNDVTVPPVRVYMAPDQRYFGA
jgi:hypothetical protein